MPEDFAQQVADAHGYLLKFARLQLRNEVWAEDVVSETMVDALRSHRREVTVGDADDDKADPLNDMAFKPDGHFQERPADWDNPQQDLQSRQFMAVLEACTDKLPAVQGRLFLMREWLEMSSEEICQELQLTSTNLCVQWHRARLRLRLRECLELNWCASQP